MSGQDALVVFTPSGRRGRFPLGSSLLQAARSLGVDIDSVCGGRGICGRCQVLVAEGEFSKHGVTSCVDNLSAVSAVEQEYCAIQPMAPGRRLSCSAQVLGDLVGVVEQQVLGLPALAQAGAVVSAVALALV